MKKWFGYLTILLDIVFTILFVSRGEWLIGVATGLCAVFGILDVCFFSSTKNNYDEEDEDWEY